MEENQVPKFELVAGQQKNLQSERVVLVPGPASELEIVRRIFESFVTEGSHRAIRNPIIPNPRQPSFRLLVRSFSFSFILETPAL
jgi:hypothetical protein